MRANLRLRNRCQCEALEPRQMLAGNVMVDVVNGQLVITGDAADNQIAITQAEAPTGANENSAFVITGLDGTTLQLEGSTSGASEVTVTGVHRGAQIEMGDGNDAVSLTGATVRGRVAMQMGAGNDQVHIGVGESGDATAAGLPTDSSVRVRGALQIGTGSGDDQVLVHNALIGGSLHIHTGDDNDGVSLGASLVEVGTAAAEGTIGRPPGGAPGPIGDPGGIETANSQLRVNGGIQLNLGSGSDSASLSQVAASASISVNAGDGDDSVHAQETRAFAMTVLGGEGIDSVSVDDVELRHLGVYTGDGDDRVEILDSAFASLVVVLADGDDSLLIAGARAKFAALLGGNGADALTQLRPNVFEFDVIDGFELTTLPPVDGRPPFPGADWPSLARRRG